MNPIELFHKNGKSAGVFYCYKCHRVAKSKDAAEECCTPTLCKFCGKPCRQYHTCCDDCSKSQSVKAEQERFDKAEKLTKWDGWVFSDGLGFHNGFAESVSDLLDQLDDDEAPEYVWACDPVNFAVASIDDVIRPILENEAAYEGFDSDHLNGIDELKAAIDQFNESNKHIVSYVPNFKKAVLIQKQN